MGEVLAFPPRLRLVEPTLLQKLRASLTPAPADWPGKRVMVRDIGLTGRVLGMVSDQDSGMFGWLGVQIDEALNHAATGDACRAVHRPDSAVEVWVIPTDEGRVAARQALPFLA